MLNSLWWRFPDWCHRIVLALTGRLIVMIVDTDTKVVTGYRWETQAEFERDQSAGDSSPG